MESLKQGGVGYSYVLTICVHVAGLAGVELRIEEEGGGRVWHIFFHI